MYRVKYSRTILSSSNYFVIIVEKDKDNKKKLKQSNKKLTPDILIKLKTSNGDFWKECSKSYMESNGLL